MALQAIDGQFKRVIAGTHCSGHSGFCLGGDAGQAAAQDGGAGDDCPFDPSAAVHHALSIQALDQYQFDRFQTVRFVALPTAEYVQTPEELYHQLFAAAKHVIPA
jgi:hypothetical protein